MDQKKWKSPVVWTSFAALVIAFMTDVLDIRFDTEIVNSVINGAVALLIGLGILNNPNSSHTF